MSKNGGRIIMEEKEVTVSNWFDSNEYDQTNKEDKARLPKFNINLNKGEIARSEEIMFLNNGIEVNNQYGKSIMFTINHKSVDMVWFVKAKSYTLLREIKKVIKEKKSLEGLKAIVTRAGTTQSDTRWAIKF